MSLRIYNTLTRRKEEFRPRDPGRVAMYFCGPTPYSHTHIGHLRPALTGDVIARYLKHKGFQVFYLSNFTDVDDKIIQAAAHEGVDPLALSARYAAEYLAVLEKMGIDQVDRWVKVSEHIPDIVEMVRVLVDKGFAYVLDGDVYFSVTSMPDYGKLSRRSLDELLAGARVAVDERKRHPMDFALWKAAKPGEPSWPSPWGPGRPGWHIECSAMSLKYLGNGFDIHGGGDDLIFPHHENEIAQSECYTGSAPFVRYWVHNGMIRINDEKMSKSLGNFVTAGQLLERFPPQAIRLFMLETHYRNPLNFTWEAVEEAERGWRRLENALAAAEHLLSLPPDEGAGAGTPGGEALAEEAARAERRFAEAMDDDFNTALALAALFDLARAINAACCLPDFRPSDSARAGLEAARRTLSALLGVLGFRRDAAAGGDGRLVRGLIELVIELRQEARQQRDYERADRIRARLAELGVTLEDTPQGTRYRLASTPGGR